MDATTKAGHRSAEGDDMNPAARLPIFTAEDSANRFNEVLEEALKRPVGISSRDELVAYLVSKQDIDKLFAKIEELEDQVWLKEAELGRQSGFIAAEEVDAFINDVRNSRDGEARDSE
jgi:hypothetical protein